MVREAAVAAGFCDLAAGAGATEVQQAARVIIAAATGQRTRAHNARGAAGCWRCGLLALRASRYARACDETVAGLTRRRCGLAISVTFVT